ncbi:MAG: 50S ribosomal protein L9 [Patescibacteria group bacterium]|jgi:large subunit ribosomal protein L9|nr:50S ribosomal protein L9 [Patescibacteria group bacterium]
MKKSMKVVLLKNVDNLGHVGDVKEVALGYARNFLIPKGLATEATPKAIEEVETNKAKMAKQAEDDLANAEKLAQRLEGQTVEISAKASDEGTLYAAVSAAKVASALKDKGFEVNKNQINAGHIKEIGEHELVVNLDHGLEARITLVINSE